MTEGTEGITPEEDIALRLWWLQNAPTKYIEALRYARIQWGDGAIGDVLKAHDAKLGKDADECDATVAVMVSQLGIDGVRWCVTEARRQIDSGAVTDHVARSALSKAIDALVLHMPCDM